MAMSIGIPYLPCHALEGERIQMQISNNPYYVPMSLHPSTLLASRMSRLPMYTLQHLICDTNIIA